MFDLQETERTGFVGIARGSREQITIIQYKYSNGVRICVFIITEEKELVKLENTMKTNRYRYIAKILYQK